MAISLATSSEALQAVRTLFAGTFSDIAPDAVPFTAEGHSTYDVMVVQALDADGHLQGAAMTNRAQIAVQSMMLGDDPLGYASVIDKHRELDLLAVRPDARGSGIGTQLLEFVEERLAAAGIELLFGNATSDLDVVKLRLFYERRGFTVHPSGDPLPELLGKPWTHPLAPPAAFHFHKMLDRRPRPPAGTDSPAVVPPDPHRARRPKKPKRPKNRRRP